MNSMSLLLCMNAAKKVPFQILSFVVIQCDDCAIRWWKERLLSRGHPMQLPWEHDENCACLSTRQRKACCDVQRVYIFRRDGGRSSAPPRRCVRLAEHSGRSLGADRGQITGGLPGGLWPLNMRSAPRRRRASPPVSHAVWMRH